MTQREVENKFLCSPRFFRTIIFSELAKKMATATVERVTYREGNKYPPPPSDEFRPEEEQTPLLLPGEHVAAPPRPG